MRIVIRLAGAAFLVGPLFPQGGGGVQIRDYKAPTPDYRPRISCAKIVGLTGYEISAIRPSSSNELQIA